MSSEAIDTPDVYDLRRRLHAADERAERLERFRRYVLDVCGTPKFRTKYTQQQMFAFLDEIARQAVAALSPIDEASRQAIPCQRDLTALGLPLPRTCQRCGLLGPCTGEHL